MNSLKRENLWQKSVEWNSKKMWKMISADAKTNVKQFHPAWYCTGRLVLFNEQTKSSKYEKSLLLMVPCIGSI